MLNILPMLVELGSRNSDYGSVGNSIIMIFSYTVSFELLIMYCSYDLILRPSHLLTCTVLLYYYATVLQVIYS